MHRFVMLITLVSVLLAGVAIGQIHTLGVPQRQIAAPLPPSRSTIAGAEAFYAAINETLESGNSTSLAGMLADDFVERGSIDPEANDSSALIERMASLHATFPLMRVEPVEIHSVGDFAVAMLEVTGSAQGMLAGIPVEAGDLLQGLEMLRIVEGKVVERWPAGERDVSFAGQRTIPIPRPGTSQLLLRAGLERWTLSPYTSKTLFLDSATLLIVTSDGLDLRLEPQVVPDVPLSAETRARAKIYAENSSTDPMPIPESDHVSLAPGQIVVLPEKFRVTLRNAADQAAPLYAVTIAQLAAGGTFQFLATPTGADTDETAFTRTVVAPGLLLERSSPEMRISLGRALLQPGEALPRHTAPGIELMTVTRGTVAVTADDGTVWQAGAQASAIRSSEPITIEAGSGTSAAEGSRLGYEASGDEPAEVLLVSVVVKRTE